MLYYFFLFFIFLHLTFADYHTIVVYFPSLPFHSCFYYFSVNLVSNLSSSSIFWIISFLMLSHPSNNIPFSFMSRLPYLWLSRFHPVQTVVLINSFPLSSWSQYSTVPLTSCRSFSVFSFYTCNCEQEIINCLVFNLILSTYL